MLQGLNSLNISQKRFNTICTPLIVSPGNYLYFFNFRLLRHSFLKNVKKKVSNLAVSSWELLTLNLYMCIFQIFQQNMSKLELIIFVSNMLYLSHLRVPQLPNRFLRNLALNPDHSFFSYIYLFHQQIALCVTFILLQSICLSYFYSHNFNFELMIFWQFSPMTPNNISYLSSTFY